MNDVTEVLIRVGTMQHAIDHNTNMTAKLSEAVEKIQEMNSNLCAMIKIHEAQFVAAAKLQAALDEDLKEITGRLDTLRDVKHPCHEKVTTSDEESRIRKLERWMWMIVGGAVAVGALFTFLANVWLGK